MYCRISPEFTTLGGVKESDTASSHFSGSQFIDLHIESSIFISDTCGFEVLSGCPLFDHDYLDDIALLGSDSSSHVRLGMPSASPKCKLILKSCMESKLNVLLTDEPINVVNHFSLLGTLISPVGLAIQWVTHCIAKIMAVLPNQ